MSFSRAKLNRFNDVNPCTPSPADYNVLVQTNIKYAVIPQTERFIEPKSPCVSEVGSIKSTPCFRTPTLPKIRTFLKPLSASKSNKELFTATSNEVEALKEKIVECENKDATIQELREQMEELRTKMSNLEKQISNLHSEKINAEKKIQNVIEENKEKCEIINKKHAIELESLNSEKAKIKEELINIANKCTEMELIEEQLLNKELELKAVEQNCAHMQAEHIEEMQKMQIEHMHEIEDIEFEMLKTMTELEREKQSAASKIQELESRLLDEIHQQINNDSKLKHIGENYKENAKLNEIQQLQNILEMEQNWQTRFDEQEQKSNAILKECQEISEYTIIQTELEKNIIRANLEEKNKSYGILDEKYKTVLSNYDELNSNFRALQIEFSNVAIELNETRVNLTDELQQKQKLIEQLLKEKRAFEITINITQETIEVLKRRLINSDRDVEQLKLELTTSEEKIIDFELQTNELHGHLERAQKEKDEIEIHYESMLKLNEQEIVDVKRELTEKVNDYKGKVENYLRKLNDEKELFNEVLQQLHEQQLVNSEAFELIEAVKSEIRIMHEELESFYTKEKQWKQFEDEFVVDKKQLEDELNLKETDLINMNKHLIQLQEKFDTYYRQFEYYKSKSHEYAKEIEDAGEIHKKYIEQSGRYDQLLQKYEMLEMEKAEQNLTLDKHCLSIQASEDKHEKLLMKFKILEKENETIKKQLKEQTKLIGPFKTQLEAYESEREMLLDQKHYIQNEAHEVSLKYADILGHQNNKQKIKHLRDIKMKNEELVQTKLELESKLRLQSKTMEKIKKENADLKKISRKFINTVDDKENIGSPNRSLSSSRIESPFKERN